MDDVDISLVRELQKNINLISHPYREMADRLGLSEAELLEKARQLRRQGVMRRYGAVLRHRQAGFGANAMTCWKVPSERVEEVGRTMAAESAVTHCYERPTYPDWPYNVFAMIHGRDEEYCAGVVRRLARATGLDEYVILLSSKEYKKVRVRYFEEAQSCG